MHMVNWWQLFDLQKYWGTICYIQPLIPICLLCWHRSHQRSLTLLTLMVPSQKPKWILPHWQHLMRRRTTLVWLITYLTMLPKIMVVNRSGTYNVMLYCAQKFWIFFFLVMLIPTGTITVRVSCGHGCWGSASEDWCPGVIAVWFLVWVLEQEG